MESTLSSTVVIACPQCGTRYQVAPETLGRRGRKVTCAHCGEVWQAEPGASAPADRDRLFDAEQEAALDAAFAAAEPQPTEISKRDAMELPEQDGPMRSIAEIKAAITPRARPASIAADQAERKRQKAFAKRQAVQGQQSPVARLRRGLRLFGVATLITMIVCGIAFRTEVVRQFPDLAGAYEALGLGVNVVGLEFRDVTTLLALKGGTSVLRVDARIYSVAVRRLDVPPVVVTLLDESGARVYEWSVVPDAAQLRPGEIVDFSTQLSSPPPAAARVRLTFADGRSRSGSAVTTNVSN